MPELPYVAGAEQLVVWPPGTLQAPLIPGGDNVQLVKPDGTPYVALSEGGITRTQAQFDRVNSQTFQTVPGLVLVLSAGQTYRLRAELDVVAGTGGFKVRLGPGAGPLTATALWYYITARQDGVTTDLRLVRRESALAGSPTAYAGAGDFLVEIAGVITVGIGAQLVVQFACQNNDGSTSSVRLNSLLQATLIGSLAAPDG